MGISAETIEENSESQPIEIDDQMDGQSEGLVGNQNDPFAGFVQGDLGQTSQSFLDSELFMPTDDPVIDNL